MEFCRVKLSNRRKDGFMNSGNYSRADYYRRRKNIMNQYEDDEEFQGYSRTSEENKPKKNSILKSIFSSNKKQ